MKRRSLLAGIAASALILTGCTDKDADTTPQPTLTEGSKAPDTPVPTTPEEKFAFAEGEVDPKEFTKAITEANKVSFRSVTTSEPEGGKTVMEYEPVGDSANIHTHTTAGNQNVETIAIGDKVWRHNNGKWELVDGIILGVGSDSLDTYADHVNKVTYEGTDEFGHRFAVGLSAIEGLASARSTMWTDDKLLVVRNKVDFTTERSYTGSTTEVRTDHGKKFGIKAPA